MSLILGKLPSWSRCPPHQVIFGGTFCNRKLLTAVYILNLFLIFHNTYDEQNVDIIKLVKELNFWNIELWLSYHFESLFSGVSFVLWLFCFVTLILSSCGKESVQLPLKSAIALREAAFEAQKIFCWQWMSCTIKILKA